MAQEPERLVFRARWTGQSHEQATQRGPMCFVKQAARAADGYREAFRKDGDGRLDLLGVAAAFLRGKSSVGPIAPDDGRSRRIAAAVVAHDDAAADIESLRVFAVNDAARCRARMDASAEGAG